MGWKEVLGGIAGIGGIAAAPFTGGTSLSWVPAALGAAGAGLGAMSQSQASNRGNKFAGQSDLAQQMMMRDLGQGNLEGQADRDFHSQSLSREQDGRAGRQDAWRKLQSAERTLSPGAQPQLSTYSIAPREATANERSGAGALSAEVLARLQGGNPLPDVTRRDVSVRDPNDSVDRRLLDASGSERAMGGLSALLGGLGSGLQQASKGDPDVMARLRDEYFRKYGRPDGARGGSNPRPGGFIEPGSFGSDVSRNPYFPTR